MTELQRRQWARFWTRYKAAVWWGDFVFTAAVVSVAFWVRAHPSHAVEVAICLCAMVNWRHGQEVSERMARNDLLTEVYELRDENKRLKKSLEMRP